MLSPCTYPPPPPPPHTHSLVRGGAAQEHDVAQVLAQARQHGARHLHHRRPQLRGGGVREEMEEKDRKRTHNLSYSVADAHDVAAPQTHVLNGNLSVIAVGEERERERLDEALLIIHSLPTYLS